MLLSWTCLPPTPVEWDVDRSRSVARVPNTQREWDLDGSSSEARVWNTQPEWDLDGSSLEARVWNTQREWDLDGSSLGARVRNNQQDNLREWDGQPELMDQDRFLSPRDIVGQDTHWDQDMPTRSLGNRFPVVI